MRNCPTCGVSLYKVNDGKCSDGAATTNSRPAKVYWYFPIMPRFKRLFASAYDAKNLRWHADGRIINGLLQYPAP